MVGSNNYQRSPSRGASEPSGANSPSSKQTTPTDQSRRQARRSSFSNIFQVPNFGPPSYGPPPVIGVKTGSISGTNNDRYGHSTTSRSSAKRRNSTGIQGSLFAPGVCPALDLIEQHADSCDDRNALEKFLSSFAQMLVPDDSTFNHIFHEVVQRIELQSVKNPSMATLRALRVIWLKTDHKYDDANVPETLWKAVMEAMLQEESGTADPQVCKWVVHLAKYEGDAAYIELADEIASKLKKVDEPHTFQVACELVKKFFAAPPVASKTIPSCGKHSGSKDIPRAQMMDVFDVHYQRLLGIERELFKGAWKVGMEFGVHRESEKRRPVLKLLVPTLLEYQAFFECDLSFPVFCDICRALTEKKDEACKSDALMILVASPQVFPFLSLGIECLSGTDCEFNESPYQQNDPCKIRFGNRWVTKLIAWALARPDAAVNAKVDRKRGVWLLQKIIDTRFNVQEESGAQCEEFDLTVKQAKEGWNTYFSLLDSVEDYGVHVLKQNWPKMGKKMFSGCASPICTHHKDKDVACTAVDYCDGCAPRWLLQSFWIEAFFKRCLGHDNDSVRKYAVQQLMATARSDFDGDRVRYSDWFVIDELIPLFNHHIEAFFPPSDLELTNESNIHMFLSRWIRQRNKTVSTISCSKSSFGDESNYERIELGAFGDRWKLPSSSNEGITVFFEAMDKHVRHHTPMRVLLQCLLRCGITNKPIAKAPGALSTKHMAAGLKWITAPPVCSRRKIFKLLVDVLAMHCDVEAIRGPWFYIEFMANIPDELLDVNEEGLAILANNAHADHRLFDWWSTALSNAEAAIRITAPSASRSVVSELSHRITAAQWVVRVRGLVRIAKAADFSAKELNAILEPVVSTVYSNPYMPWRTAACALFGMCYSQSLFGPSEGTDAMWTAAVSFCTGKIMAIIEDEKALEQELPWIWLHSFVLTKRAEIKSLPPCKEIVDLVPRLVDVISKEGANQLLSAFILPLLSGLVHYYQGERMELFQTILKLRFKRPAGISSKDPVSTDAGLWTVAKRSQGASAGGALRRQDTEGFAPPREWKDVAGLFEEGRWRCLANIVFQCEKEVDSRFDTQITIYLETKNECPIVFVRDLVDDLGISQPPYLAHHCAILRRVLPIVFGEGTSCTDDEQREIVKAICTGTYGIMQSGVGERRAMHLTSLCRAELGKTALHPLVLQAERRLFEADDNTAPTVKLLQSMLALGECCNGVARSAIVPFLHSLAHAVEIHEEESLLDGHVEVLADLCLYRERALNDSSFRLVSTTFDMSNKENENDTENVPSTASLGKAQFESPYAPASGSTQEQLIDCVSSTRTEMHESVAFCRVAVLIFLDRYGDIRKDKDSANGLIERVAAKIFDKLDDVIKELEIQTSKSKKRAPTDVLIKCPMQWSIQHRIQMRGWQALMTLSRHISLAASRNLLDTLFNRHLAQPHAPDVRDYQDMVAFALVGRFPQEVIRPYLIPALLKVDLPVQCSVTFILISGYLLLKTGQLQKQCTEGNVGKECSDLLHALFPFLTHNSAYVRATAQYFWFYALDPVLGKDADESKKEELLTSLGFDSVLLPESIYNMMATQKECIKMRNRQAPVWRDWDPLGRFALQALTQDALVLPVSKATGDHYFQGDTKSLWAHVFGDGDFKPTCIFVEELRSQISDQIQDLWDRSDISLYPSNSDEWYNQILVGESTRAMLEASKTNDSDSKVHWDEKVENDDDDLNFQRKFQPDGERADTLTNRKCSPLIAVASLIDKTPNLAGLTRTSEIFGLEKLVVPNDKIIKDGLFQSISVAAERWMPIQEVKPPLLADFLREKKNAGYSIVGVEQTQNSVPLQDFIFPSMCVLVLGAEKEGISASLLPFMDHCVEIPQQGKTRSLNVHVSGSICMWEYARQQLNKKKEQQKIIMKAHSSRSSLPSTPSTPPLAPGRSVKSLNSL